MDPNRYHLAIPAEAMYGWAKDAAKSIEFPHGFTYTAILAWYAGTAQLSLADPDGDLVQTNLYVAHLAGVGKGKSRAMHLVNRLLHPGDHDAAHILDRAPASDRGLFSLIGYDVEPDEPRPDLTFKTMLVDELSGMFTKMGIQNATLADVLCTLWSKRSTGSAAKGSNQAVYAQLSICGCLPVTNLTEFRDKFSAVTGNGLHDRFVVVPGPPTWKSKWSKKGRPARLKIAGRKAIPVEFSEEVLSLMDAWGEEHPELVERCPRSLELAHRIAGITSALNHDGIVTKECMLAALCFAEWQAQVKAEFKASSAKNEQGKITELLIDAFTKCEVMYRRGENDIVKGRPLIAKNGFVHLSSLMTKWHLYDLGGPNVKAVLRSLVDLKFEEETAPSGSDGKGREKPTGYYRLLDGEVA